MWRSNEKGPPSSSYSQTLKNSKENGVFEFEVIAYKSNLILDTGLRLEIKNAWVENLWSQQPQVFGTAPIVKVDSTYQLILNLNIIRTTQQGTNNFYYFMGNKPLDTFFHFYCHRIDTIRVPLYRELLPQFPHERKEKHLTV